MENTVKSHREAIKGLFASFFRLVLSRLQADFYKADCDIRAVYLRSDIQVTIRAALQRERANNQQVLHSYATRETPKLARHSCQSYLCQDV